MSYIQNIRINQRMSSSIDLKLFNREVKCFYYPGDKIFDICRKKKGIIRRLRDDTYEKSQIESDPTHYYYYIDYDDGTFDTYVCCRFLVSDN